MNQLEAFSAFLEDEMKKRDMSNREFAKYIGVAHATINRYVDRNPDKEQHYPSLDFLHKLAKKTGVDICSIIGLIFPDGNSVSAEARILSQQIEMLPEHQRQIVDAIIRGIGLGNQGVDKQP